MTHRTRLVSVLIACVPAASCAARTTPVAPVVVARTDAPAPTPAVAFDAFVQRYFDERFQRIPSEATEAGVHTHDGELEDLGEAGTLALRSFLRRSLDEVRRMVPTLPESREAVTDPMASDHPRLDAELLADALALELHRLEDWNERATDPDHYHQLASSALYALMQREFAPKVERVRSLTQRLRALPGLLAAGETRLAHPSRLAVETALRNVDGSVALVRDTVPAFVQDVADAERTACLDAARAATAALEAHRTFLRERLLPAADGDYRDGRERWTTRARLADGVTESPEDLRDAALDEVRRLQAEIRAIARRISRRDRPLEVLRRVRSQHPTAAGLLDAYRARQSAVRTFVTQRGLVSIDAARDDLALEETPAFLRATVFAALNAPGPLERIATRTLFFVTPAAATLSPREVEDYLQEHASPGIDVTTIHEAYPGHHVHALHQRNARSYVRRLLWHGAYGEGWAHYAEQLLVDEGYGDDAVRLEQTEQSLLRAARAYLDVGIHVFGLSVEDAARFYRDEAYLTPVAADIEARRVALQPASVFVYTYGKAALFRLRRAVGPADAAALARFHDAILDFGSAPVASVATTLFGRTLGPWARGEILSMPALTAPAPGAGPAAPEPVRSRRGRRVEVPR